MYIYYILKYVQGWASGGDLQEQQQYQGGEHAQQVLPVMQVQPGHQASKCQVQHTGPLRPVLWIRRIHIGSVFRSLVPVHLDPYSEYGFGSIHVNMG